jgi:hypothetical protein
MDPLLNRRQWLAGSAACAAAALGAGAAQDDPPALPVISGKPRERGRQYGRLTRESLLAFRSKEFGAALNGQARGKVLAYAAGCGTGIGKYAPVVMEELAVERHEGHLARHQYGSRKMTRTPEGQEVRHNARTAHTHALLRRSRGKLDRAALQAILSDPVVKGGPIDLMLFDATRKKAHVMGRSARADAWSTFRFDA